MQLELSFEDKHITVLLDKDDDITASCALAISLAPEPAEVELVIVKKPDKNGKLLEYKYKVRFGLFSRINKSGSSSLVHSKWLNLKGVVVASIQDEYKKALETAKAKYQKPSESVVEKQFCTPESVAEMLISALHQEQLASLLALEGFGRMKMFAILNESLEACK